MSSPSVLDLRGTMLAPSDLEPVAAHVRREGLIAYPTETVYGFGGLCSPGAVALLRGLKRRAEGRPLLVLVRSAAGASGLRWTDEARELASLFWPGSVTLVLRDPDGIFPDGVRSPEGAVAVRVSPHPFVAGLLDLLGTPLTSTSANAPGAVPAMTGSGALDAALRVGAGQEMLVVDCGSLPRSGPSTIVDCCGATPVVVREGTVPLSRLRCAVPEIHGR